MGYDVHITRKESWADEEGPTISLSEWTSLVRNDPEMRLDGYAEADLGMSTLRTENEGLSVWVAYSGHGKNGNMAWFDFREGDVVVKNPDQEILRKMWLIAQQLSAKIQGDDGELYDGSGNEIGEPDEAARSPHSQPSWWKRLLGFFNSGQRTSDEGAASVPALYAVTFNPGDRVKDALMNHGTVIESDPKANGGLGSIRVRYDDGHEATFALVASGLELLSEATQTDS